MEHFSYTIQLVLPILFLLLLGSLLRRVGIITDVFVSEGDKFCLLVLFPVLIFRSIFLGKADSFLGGIWFSYVVIAVSFVGGVLIIPRFIHDRNRISVFIQSMYRGNFTLYGIPFAQLLGGPGAAAVASAITAATLPALNVAGVSMYAHYAGKNQSILTTARKVLQNPLIWGVILGIVFQKAHIDLPIYLDKFIESLAQIASPLAFILLGTKLRRSSFTKIRFSTVFILLYKLVIMPAIFLPLAIFVFRLRGDELLSVCLFVAAPCAISTYQLAVQYHADDTLAGNLVTLSTVFSTLSICVIISILKSAGLL